MEQTGVVKRRQRCHVTGCTHRQGDEPLNEAERRELLVRPSDIYFRNSVHQAKRKLDYVYLAPFMRRYLL